MKIQLAQMQVCVVKEQKKDVLEVDLNERREGEGSLTVIKCLIKEGAPSWVILV